MARNSVIALGGTEAPPEQTKLMISGDRLPVESGSHQAVFFLRPDPKAKLELEELKVREEVKQFAVLSECSPGRGPGLEMSNFLMFSTGWGAGGRLSERGAVAVCP